MPKKCEHCGETAFEDDERVCKACGVVTDDIIFGQEFTVFQRTTAHHQTAYSSVSHSKVRFSNKAKPKIALQYGLSALKNLCHVFSIPTEQELEVKDMLTNVYPTKKFKVKEDVGVLAGCCLFLVQRRNNQPMPLNKICLQLECTRKRFGYFLNFLKSWLSITSPNFFQTPIEENNGIFSHCIKKEIDSDPNLPEGAESLIPVVCKEAPVGEKRKLLKKTTELVKLANSCWLYTGRSPHSVIVACAFLCWKSMYPSRKNASFSNFCSVMKVHDPVAKVRLPELKALLLQLGKKIPSRTENYVNESNLLFHLDRILENSETLRNDLLKDEFIEENIICKEFSNFRHPPIRKPRRTPRSTVDCDSDINASDVYISDTEIESYIVRNPQKETIEDLCKKNVSLPSTSS